jgi:asparagine synthase (glutamine-hydrolysing)
MCGIAGFVGPGAVSQLDAMMARLVHRGPDDAGQWISEKDRVFLGHRRLSILDLDCGRQPMETADGSLVVTFNGEIYNHAALRGELAKKGHAFRTDHSDTEVLLHGYREWGGELPLHLNGMFAFALWDRAHRRLFCVRDRFGEKPFFYAQRGDLFAFGSELTALETLPALELRRSPRSIQKYMAYGYVPAPLTIYGNASKLPGGHTLTWHAESSTCEIRKYWSFEIEPFDAPSRAQELQWEEQLRELVERSVRARLQADVPVGIFLSGGIDSSTVTAFAMRAGVPVKTFTIGFREKSFDESEMAKRIAGHLGAEHFERIFSIGNARETLGDILSGLDEPLGDASVLPTAMLSRFARQSVKVALGGDGADELFAGYDPFLALRKAEIYNRMVPKPVHLAIRLLLGRLPVSHANMSFDFKIKRTLRGLAIAPACRLPVWMSGFDPADARELFENPLPLEDLFSEAVGLWENSGATSIGDRTLQYFMQLYLQNDILVKTDRASMRYGLEVRSPFLDCDLVDFVRRIPYACKLRGGRTKYLLKRAMAPLLPAETIHRAKKGFGVPIGQWLRRGEIGPDPARALPPIRAKFIARALAEHRAGKIDHRMLLWNEIALQAWAGSGQRQLA